ncbi:MAG: Dam family site-specific DNA-(adenine-N6)-methyltransferase [Acidobacteria bacterium]|nr:Dam family site-specific DNA-(adenine-N6)-methyltransferase [Acidobacteriota bacterium]
MTSASTESVAAQPLLKWAGGKRQLLPKLRRFYPATFLRYWEPFLGSAAVFFDLHARGSLEGRPVVLADNNPDLIACYTTVRDATEEVIVELAELARNHEGIGETHYYGVRDRQFNPQRRALFAAGLDGPVAYTPQLAAMFIYLNRTGYNGLFRLNADGEFNVPAGRYLKPRICDPGNLNLVASALRDTRVTLAHQRFDRVLDEAGAGDFLYFDPPYAPLSRTAKFTGYTAEGFTKTHQQRLRQVIIELARRGCHVVLSNSTAPEISELYARDDEVAAAGFRCHTVPARRAINSNPQRRGTVEEYVITNVREV